MSQLDIFVNPAIYLFIYLFTEIGVFMVNETVSSV